MFTHSLSNFFYNTLPFPGARVLARAFSKLLLPPLKERVISPTIFGFDLVFRPGNGYYVYYTGFYEIGTLEVIKNCLRAGDVFLDIGSSVGLMTFCASRSVGKSGKVIAFEPTKNSFEDLCYGIDLNKTENIKALNIGLGSENTHIKIYTDRACPSMVELADDSGAFEEVPIKKLDDVLEQEQIPNVKMMKIDVEGFELEVIKGAKKILSSSGPPIICIEYIRSLKKINNDELGALDLILSYNTYQLFQLTKTSHRLSKLRKVEQMNDLHEHDNVYCFHASHFGSVEPGIFESNR